MTIYLIILTFVNDFYSMISIVYLIILTTP